MVSFGLDGFKAVDLSDTAGFSRSADPNVKVSDKLITFNSQFCRQLHCSKYIDVLINPEQKRVAFVARDKPTKTSRRFYQSKNGKESGRPVYWTGKEIRHAMDVITNRNQGDTLQLTGESRPDMVIISL